MEARLSLCGYASDGLDAIAGISLNERPNPMNPRTERERAETDEKEYWLRHYLKKWEESAEFLRRERKEHRIEIKELEGKLTQCALDADAEISELRRKVKSYEDADLEAFLKDVPTLGELRETKAEH